MRLSPASGPAQWNLLLSCDIGPGAGQPELPLILDSGRKNGGNSISCNFIRTSNNIDLADQMMELGLLIASSAEARGGLLLHGALAEKNGRGILLAGPSDVGKTTASRRLPPPWRSCSDDCTLIVREQGGRYMAHPWPTWSSFLDGDHGQSWDVQASVPLQAVILMSQGEMEHIAPLRQGRAACMLYEIAEQAWYGLNTEYDRTKLQKLRARRFANICELVRHIPAYTLYLSKDGAFWEQIEQVL
jgi:SynChlorMet cassette protein ScmC